MAVVVGIFYTMYQNRAVFGAADLAQHRIQTQQQTARFNEEMARRSAAAAASSTPGQEPK